MPASKIEYIIKHQFNFVKEQIKKGNEVLLHGFGSFEILKHNVYLKLKNLLKLYRSKKIEKDYFEKEFKKYWEIKKKL